MKVGFIGLGSIGSVMAGHLIKAGYTLIVHDLDPVGRRIPARCPKPRIPSLPRYPALLRSGR
jgi:pyrroline-5-carboxylate reductase